jgi:hypothetical protein
VSVCASSQNGSDVDYPKKGTINENEKGWWWWQSFSLSTVISFWNGTVNWLLSYNKMKYLQKQMAYMNLCNILGTFSLFLIKR